MATAKKMVSIILIHFVRVIPSGAYSILTTMKKSSQHFRIRENSKTFQGHFFRVIYEGDNSSQNYFFQDRVILVRDNSINDLQVNKIELAMGDNSIGKTREKLPRTLLVQHRFGRLSVQHRFGRLSVQHRFGRLSVQHRFGRLSVQHRFGRLLVQHRFGRLSVQHRFGRLLVQHRFGRLSVQHRFGRLSVQHRFGRLF